jgi:ribosomal protein S19E (S16A)
MMGYVKLGEIKNKKPDDESGFLFYRAATFFWKKSLNFFLVSMVSTGQFYGNPILSCSD